MDSLMQSYDDTSPYIAYHGDWKTQPTTDPYVQRYKNSTFHSSTNDGDSAVIVFIGTEIKVYGAKRPNHGFLSGLIDGGEKQYVNGTAKDPELYQQVIFQANNLENKTHTVIMTNEAVYNTNSGGIWFDIDFFQVNGKAISSAADAASIDQGSDTSNTYTGTVAFQTTPPSGVELPHIASKPTAVQLAVSIAPSLSNAQRPVTDRVANSSTSTISSPFYNLTFSLIMSVFLAYSIFYHFRRS
ncbi:uncharacterized protein L201_005838 [Kwoniella dendrophila CBS 6074]|uniref:Uncharacterized protein n=1 Tax=Kwoniella dendrophila CBS 6074 TaxID=1295534 RepID=A0AAX4K240_9TREE